MFDRIKNWPFLQEPLYRWGIFIIAMSLMLTVWHMILEYMKE